VGILPARRGGRTVPALEPDRRRRGGGGGGGGGPRAAMAGGGSARGGARGAGRAAAAAAAAALALAAPRGAAGAGPTPRLGGGRPAGSRRGFEAAGFAGLRYTAGAGEKGAAPLPWLGGAGAGGGLACSEDPFEEVAVGEHAAVRLYRGRAPAGGGSPPREQAPPGPECPGSAPSGAVLWAARAALCALAAWARSRLLARAPAARGAAPRPA